jgi:hypothetical protein
MCCGLCALFIHIVRLPRALPHSLLGAHGVQPRLPPATSKPPFIVLPNIIRDFSFRTMQQNRRVAEVAGRTEELQKFHEVLADVSLGRPTRAVRDFFVDAYVRGAVVGCAERCELEGSTAVYAT